MGLNGPISGETGYMIVWFSHCHPRESALWELKRKNWETPRHQIGPARQLAAKSNNYTDLTPYFYSTVSRLLIADIVCAFNESWWCLFHCDCTSDIFVWGLRVISPYWECMWSRTLPLNLIGKKKWETSKSRPLNGCQARQGWPLFFRGHVSGQLVHIPTPQLNEVTLQMWN